MSGFHEKLERLEDAGVKFRAGYFGGGEVFTACFPDGTFVDFEWLETNDRGDIQFLKPTELKRVIDETLEWIEDGTLEERLKRMDEVQNRDANEA